MGYDPEKHHRRSIRLRGWDYTSPGAVRVVFEPERLAQAGRKHLERLRDGTRKVLKVTEVVGMQGDVVMLQDIFEFRQTGVKNTKITGHFTATGHIPRFLDRIRAAGVDLPLSLFTPQ